MSAFEEEEPPQKIPRLLKSKESGKRLIVILEHATLETVKVKLYAQNFLF